MKKNEELLFLIKHELNDEYEFFLNNKIDLYSLKHLDNYYLEELKSLGLKIGSILKLINAIKTLK